MHDLNREAVDRLTKDLKQYSALFNVISALQEVIGLDAQRQDIAEGEGDLTIVGHQ